MPGAPDRIVARAEQVRWERGAGIVWELYDPHGALIGWTLDIPARSITVRPCFSYHTGLIVPVTYTPATLYSPLT